MMLTLCYFFNFLSEAVIAAIYSAHLFHHKKNNPTLFLSFISCYILLFFLEVLFSSISINTIFFFSINALLILSNFRVSFGRAATHAAFLTSALAITELVTGLFISNSSVALNSYRSNLSLLIALSIIGRLLYFVVLLLVMKIFGKAKNDPASPTILVLALLPIISMIIASVVIIIGMNSELNATVELLMIIISLVLLFINVTFVGFYYYTQKMYSQNVAIQLKLQKEKADATYYQAMGKLSENQRILTHDIKNHLAAITALAQDNNSPGILKYIQEIQPNPSLPQQIRLYPEPMLNYLLQQVQETCTRDNILFTCDIRENSLDQVDGPSLIALFGNLLSNAVEAATQSTARWVELSVTRNIDQGSLIISVANSCNTPPIQDSAGILYTTKNNSQLHGFGLKSIKRIIDKLHGVATMYYDDTQKEFHHIIQFPLDEKTIP